MEVNRSQSGSGQNFGERIGKKFRSVGNRWALIGGLLTVSISLLVRFFVGRVYGGAETIKLIQALADSSLYLGAAIATSSATILALMLTILGLAKEANNDFNIKLYHRIDVIGLLSAVSLCGAILLLLLLSLPVGQFDNLAAGWFTGLYYTLVVLIAALSGLLISTILMLFSTIRSIIASLTPTDEV